MKARAHDIRHRVSVDVPYRPGQLILGKYRVTSVLGAGGMGFVLAATHLRMGGPVALKMLLPELAVDPTFVERFAREAHSASKIRSEHVARVLDVETLDDGLPVIVMEMLDGHDLANEVKLNGPLPLEKAADFVLQACEAVAEAHSLGIIHRDLKPANLFLTRRADGSELIKVMDFGIAKAMEDANHPSLTTTQDVVGSPLYMSPEQLRSSKDVDARTDVWSLGVILYELVSGDVPFTGASSAAVLAAVAADRPRPIVELLPDAPAAFTQLLEKALEKSPADRHDNVADFASELGPLAPESARLSTERVSRIIYGLGGPPQLAAESTRRSGSATTVIAGSASRATPPASVKDLPDNPASTPISLWQRIRIPSFVAIALILTIGVATGLSLRNSTEAEQSKQTNLGPQDTAAETKTAQDTTPPVALTSSPQPESTKTESTRAESTKTEPPSVEPPVREPTAGKLAGRTVTPLIQTNGSKKAQPAAPTAKPLANKPSLIEQATETRK